MKISVGSHVKYSRSFLRSISAFTGKLPFARGIVKELQPVGSSLILARIDWQDPEVPERVNVKNLALAQAREIE